MLTEEKAIIAIIGRVNVGKSTLFNRIIGSKVSIVKDDPAITRDRIYAECEWKEVRFILVDTGGIEYQANDDIQKKVLSQTKIAIEEANLILFLVDLKEGLQNQDYEIAQIIRKKNKAVILVANKGDIKESSIKKYEFFALGLGEPFLISAEHNWNIESLLNKIIASLPQQYIQSEKKEEEKIKVAIVGKPNVGKSSLLNCILGEERIITSEYPGTTREAIEVNYRYENMKLILVDTAGLRDKSIFEKDIEFYGSLRAKRAINDSEIVLLVLDATLPVSVQDKKIAHFIKEQKKAYILILNKYDLLNINQDKNLLIKQVQEDLSFLKNIPIIMTSAKTGYNINKIFRKIKEISLQYDKQIPASVLNIFIRKVISSSPPKSWCGGILKIKYITQIGKKPPRFLLLVNNPKFMYKTFLQYIENKFYEEFGFEGSPISFELKRKERR